MDILTVEGVRIAGVVACKPERLCDNREGCSELFGGEVDTLIKATGIQARCMANPGTTALDLNVAAAREVLKQTNTQPEEIGALICVTFTPEYLMPADAPAAQARLGMPKHSMAFDVNMACSGYGYGLYLGATIARQMGKKVLVLDGDVQTAYVSQTDKATAPVLADMGTATLLEPWDGATPWHFSFYTDGAQRKVLYIPAGGSKNGMHSEDLVAREYEDGSRRRDADIYMDGFEVFRFVSMTASKFIAEYMQDRGLSADTIDVFAPHQANIYMIKQLTKKLKIPAEKMWKSGDVYGNPASASVPVTIAANAGEWFRQGGAGKTLLSGFGGGLSISVADIELNQNAYYGVIDIEQQSKSEES